jgi:hypothetical protein
MDALALEPSGSVRLLCNEGGGSFTDATEAAGLAPVVGARTALLGDWDLDGQTDLLLGTESGVQLFRQVDGVFVDRTGTSGLAALGSVGSAGWVDTDGDRRPDLHLAVGEKHHVFVNDPSGLFRELELGLYAHESPGVAIAGGAGTAAAETGVVSMAESTGGKTERPREGGVRGNGSGGRQAASVPGTTITPNIGPSTSGGVLGQVKCVVSLTDQSGAGCLEASTVPTLGMLYPLGNEFYIDAVTGNVGVGTTTPGYALEVAGQLVSGTGNVAAGADSAMGGGKLNTAAGDQATIAGGESNTAPAIGSFVGGGLLNSALSSQAAVAGGVANRATYRSFVGGGTSNAALGNESIVVGGKLNEARQGNGFVGGGDSNISDATFATIVGGRNNSATGLYSFIGGGGDANSADGNAAPGDWSTVAGGSGNEANGDHSIVSGGSTNTADGTRSSVGGGFLNTATGNQSVVAGGFSNQADHYATVSGGHSNLAAGSYSAIGGGQTNHANGVHATVGGGEGNSANGDYSTVAGGSQNDAAGSSSMAAGHGAKANHDGSFVWGDSTLADFASTGTDQFLIRANGGVGIGTNAPSAALDVVQDGASGHAFEVEITDPTSSGHGVHSVTPGVGGLGIWGEASHPTGVTFGMYGICYSPFGYGGFFQNAGGGVAGHFEGRVEVTGQVQSSGPGASFVCYNPTNGTAQAKLDWDSDVARIRVGGSGAGATSGLDIQTTGDTSLMRILHSGEVGIGTTSPDLQLHIEGGTDVKPIGGGFLQCGDSGGQNLAIDDNEIMARDMGAVAPLFLNASGGDVNLFSSGPGQLGVGSDLTIAENDLHYTGSSSLTLRSDEDLSMDASKDMTVDVSKDMTVDVTDDLTVAARTILVDATDTLLLKGKTGATLSANTGAVAIDAGSSIQLNAPSVNVTGSLTKGSGTFKIDHPLDPQGKYLYHSFVESPDMMNVYNGNVVLSAFGEATVELPDWFEALNREFRYQLTCIGGFAPVFVADEIVGNRFRIAGGRPGLKVSWQVTGIRHDAYAEANRVQVEVEKGPNERGRYLHPKAFE